MDGVLLLVGRGSGELTVQAVSEVAKWGHPVTGFGRLNGVLWLEHKLTIVVIS